jgi:cytochrome c553
MRLLSVTLLAVACGGRSAPASSGAPVTTTMDDHFVGLSRLRDLVIAGDLDAARQVGTTFAGGLRDQAHPDGWHPYLQDVRAGTWRAARAPDLATAAVGVARAGVACGACHLALGVRAVSADDEVVAARTGQLDDFMHRHRWAVDRMWIGLVAPSDAAWDIGAQALGTAGAFPLTDVLRADPDSVTLAERLVVVGTDAAAARAPAERAGVFAELIGACARCHRHLGDVVD